MIFIIIIILYSIHYPIIWHIITSNTNCICNQYYCDNHKRNTDYICFICDLKSLGLQFIC